MAQEIQRKALELEEQKLRDEQSRHAPTSKPDEPSVRRSESTVHKPSTYVPSLAKRSTFDEPRNDIQEFMALWNRMSETDRVNARQIIAVQSSVDDEIIRVHQQIQALRELDAIATLKDLSAKRQRLNAELDSHGTFQAQLTTPAQPASNAPVVSSGLSLNQPTAADAPVSPPRSPKPRAVARKAPAPLNVNLSANRSESPDSPDSPASPADSPKKPRASRGVALKKPPPHKPRSASKKDVKVVRSGRAMKAVPSSWETKAKDASDAPVSGLAPEGGSGLAAKRPAETSSLLDGFPAIGSLGGSTLGDLSKDIPKIGGSTEPAATAPGLDSFNLGGAALSFGTATTEKKDDNVLSLPKDAGLLPSEPAKADAEKKDAEAKKDTLFSFGQSLDTTFGADNSLTGGLFGKGLSLGGDTASATEKPAAAGPALSLGTGLPPSGAAPAGEPGPASSWLTEVPKSDPAKSLSTFAGFSFPPSTGDAKGGLFDLTPASKPLDTAKPEEPKKDAAEPPPAPANAGATTTPLAFPDLSTLATSSTQPETTPATGLLGATAAPAPTNLSKALQGTPAETKPADPTPALNATSAQGLFNIQPFAQTEQKPADASAPATTALAPNPLQAPGNQPSMGGFFTAAPAGDAQTTPASASTQTTAAFGSGDWKFPSLGDFGKAAGVPSTAPAGAAPTLLGTQPAATPAQPPANAFPFTPDASLNPSGQPAGGFNLAPTTSQPFNLAGLTTSPAGSFGGLGQTPATSSFPALFAPQSPSAPAASQPSPAAPVGAGRSPLAGGFSMGGDLSNSLLSAPGVPNPLSFVSSPSAPGGRARK